MVKRIGSMAWRVDVARDGQLFSLSVRNDAGREYEVLLGTVDSTPILTDLLSEMSRVHQDLPPRSFKAGDGPLHPKSVPLRPLNARITPQDGVPILTLDFGGTVLKVQVDPDALQKDLAALKGAAS